jgi:predicted CXXCH cytochrome family protein
MNCHSGMGSSGAVVKKTAGIEPDALVPEAALIGNHYFAAAAIHEGSKAADGFQYEGKPYVGVFEHAEGVGTCVECHDPHSTRINKPANSDANLCSSCHSNVAGYADYKKVSVSKVDYDGNGTVAPIFDEIESLKAKLMQAIVDYSKTTAGSTFVFNDGSFPYAFIDTNEDGQASEEESVRPNQYIAWTPRMLQAAYNYMFTSKAPGAYVHNGKYVLQLMYDSIEDLGGSTAGMVRP